MVVLDDISSRISKDFWEEILKEKFDPDYEQKVKDLFIGDFDPNTKPKDTFSWTKPSKRYGKPES